jgi:NADH-quinone oxidoreductase subunit H
MGMKDGQDRPRKSEETVDVSIVTAWVPLVLWAQQAPLREIPWLRWLAWLILGFFGIFPGIVAYLVLAERKIAGRFQDRIGPNRVGPFGLLQPIADAIKLVTKEDVVPRSADHWVHLLSPVLLIVSAFLPLAVIPFGVGLAPVNLPAGLVYLLAASSLSSLGVFLAGWSSRNKYSLLGAMRAVAQLISYEVPQVLATVPVALWAGSLSLVEIVDFQQREGWFLFSPPGLVSFGLLLIASIAEVNRTPFDLPEAESEIIAGYHTEYSGMRFGLFFLAEYLSVFGVCCLITVLFLGGGAWVPFSNFPRGLIGSTTFSLIFANTLMVLGFLLKVLFLIFVMFWIRATLPRMRVDRLMNFAWKYLIPLAILNILAAAVWFEIVIKPPYHNYWMLPVLPGLRLFSIPIDTTALAGWFWTGLILVPSILLVLWLNRGPKPSPTVLPAPRRRLSRTVAVR